MSEPNGTWVRVLPADDTALIRKAVTRLLTEEPAINVVAEAANFSQAIQMASTFKPDIVLLDLHMPDDYAFEPAYIRNQLALCGSKVLGMSLSSGENDEESRLLAESLGAVTLLDKGEFDSILIPTILQLAGRSSASV
jgi:chemotaxis response regulator CheB